MVHGDVVLLGWLYVISNTLIIQWLLKIHENLSMNVGTSIEYFPFPIFPINMTVLTCTSIHQGANVYVTLYGTTGYRLNCTHTFSSSNTKVHVILIGF